MGAGGGATVAGMLVALLRFAGSRNISALDDTLKSLRASTDILSKDVRDLREANIGLAKDIGALSGRIDAHEKEIATVRRHVHRWGAFLQKLTLRTATGEHVKIEVPDLGDDD